MNWELIRILIDVLSVVMAFVMIFIMYVAYKQLNKIKNNPLGMIGNMIGGNPPEPVGEMLDDEELLGVRNE